MTQLFAVELEPNLGSNRSQGYGEGGKSIHRRMRSVTASGRGGGAEDLL